MHKSPKPYKEANAFLSVALANVSYSHYDASLDRTEICRWGSSVDIYNAWGVGRGIIYTMSSLDL